VVSPLGEARHLWRAVTRAGIYRVSGESEQCPACGSPRLYELDLLPVRRAEGRRLGFVSGCDTCGIVFSNPLPSADDLEHFYRPGGDWRPSRKPEAVEDLASGHVGRALSGSPRGGSWSWPFEPIRQELSVTEPPAGARVLDFGCGTGRLLDALQAHGWDTCGIEPALDDAFRKHRRLEFIPDAPAFDLIVAHHVLEHLPDPMALLRQFARASKPGGFLFLSTPRFDTLPVHRDYRYVINGRAHVTAYTWDCMQVLLGRTGWVPVGLPPDRVAKGGGRTTASRLRVFARRTDQARQLPADPAAAARSAMREYHRGIEGRPLVERLGWYRFAARRAEAARQRAKRTRKSAKIGAAAS
jgi:SAM-dependent methyltransferase